MIPVKDNIATDRVPAVTIALLIANVVIYILACAHGGSLISGPAAHELARHGAIPHALSHGHRAGTAFSAMFLQASIVALLVNLLFLWIFGNTIEDALGPVRFLALYAVGGVVALAVAVAAGPGSTTPLAGAAGAIAAPLGAYLVLYRGARVLALSVIPLFFGVIEIPPVVLFAAWVGAQAAFAATGLGGSGAGAYLDYAGGLAVGAAGARALATRRKPTPPTAAAYR